MNLKYFKLFANCYIVLGYKKALICDLHLGRYRNIPLDLAEIINKYSKISISDQKNCMDSSTYEIALELYKHLEVENWGHFTAIPDNFINLDEEWTHPGLINNAVLSINNPVLYNIETVINELMEINCYAIQVILPPKDYYTFINNISDLTNNSGIHFIEFVVVFSEKFDESFFINLSKKNPRIKNYIIHSAPFYSKVPIKDVHDQNIGFIQYLKDIINLKTDCGIISKDYFAVTDDLFFEAKKFNSCLNYKIFIDFDGSIKNCPSMAQSFGNIKQNSITQILSSTTFRSVWSINKDSILVCKDCEYRYICTDCRVFIQNDNNIFSKPSKCNYNPYLGLWEK